MNTAMQRLPADATWRGLHPVGCDRCERGFLMAGEPGACPLCGAEGLAPRPARVAEAAPELQVPFAVPRDGLARALHAFARAPWFPTSDLSAQRLAERAVEVWWPVWLVDATCDGRFEAELGTDYQVQSSEEVLEGGRWTTRQVQRTRVRWAPAMGSVRRRYDNVAVPAIGAHAAMLKRLGPWSDQAAAAEGDLALVVLPDRDPDEAWPEALDELAHRVAADVQRAVAADHVRGVTVTADWTEREHTWMLLPLYASWYLDDDGRRCAVWIHGVTGRAWGPRRASMRKALLWSAVLGALATAALVGAGLLFVVGIVLVFLLPVAAVLGLLAVPLYVLALWPPLHVWTTNRRERVDLPQGRG